MPNSNQSPTRAIWAQVQGQGLSIWAWLSLPVFMLVVVSILAVVLVLFDSNTRPDIAMFSWSLLAMLAVAASLAVWAVINISRELQRLGKDALNVGSGARLTDVESDIREVSDVRNAMAEMSRQISISMQMVQEQNEELAASNLELEDRVTRRTSELRNAMETAERASRAKGLFIANLSHEVRTPLNAVIGVSDLMARSDLNAAQVDMVQTIRTSSETLLALINDVLDFSKIESGKLELEQRAFDLRSCIEAATSTAAVNASRKGLELAHMIAPDCPRLLLGDEIRLRQVLFNLIGNAVKFTSDGSVLVRAEFDHDLSCLSLSVQDSGIGIERDVQDRLFSAFEQGDASMTRRYGGTGLGLAICKGIVDAWGGTIDLHSEIGLGTIFTITIPTTVPHAAATRELPLKGRRAFLQMSTPHTAGMLAAQLGALGVRVVDDPAQAECMLSDDAPGQMRQSHIPLIHLGSLDTMAQWTMQGSSYAASRMISVPCRSEDLERVILRSLKVTPSDLTIPPQQTQEQMRLPEHMRGMRLLLAEDNAVNRKVIGMMLDRLGVQPSMVENGRQAVNALKDKEFDVVLMDLQMPELDGIGAMQEISKHFREQHKQLPVVFALTANALEADRDMALSSGMRAILSKPIKLAELRQGLIQAMDIQLKRQQIQQAQFSSSQEIMRTTLTAASTSLAPTIASEIDLKAPQHNSKTGHTSDQADTIMTSSSRDTPQLVDEQINELLDVLGPDELRTTLKDFLPKIDLTQTQLMRLSSTQPYAFEAIRQAAHGLAGSALFVGATELGQGLKQIEAYAVAQDAEGVQSTVEVLPRLASDAKQAVHHWLQAHP